MPGATAHGLPAGAGVGSSASWAQTLSRAGRRLARFDMDLDLAVWHMTLVMGSVRLSQKLAKLHRGAEASCPSVAAEHARSLACRVSALLIRA